MDRAVIDGVELEYELRGRDGEPVVLVHPGIFADWMRPISEESALADRFLVLRYHRVGCAGSSPISGPVSVAEQARLCVALMQALEIERAHVVGHSSSGNIALQLALDAPNAVGSLVVMEPALMTVPSAETSRRFVGQAMQHYKAGDSAAAVDTFLQGVCGPNYRTTLDRALPGAFAQYVADAGTFFEQELPALQQWTFTAELASRITQPVLAVLGSGSADYDQIWRERQQLLLDWLPNAEPFTLDATHLLEVENPSELAEGLAAFFTAHPLTEPPAPNPDALTP